MGRIYRPSLDRPSGATDEYPMPPCTQVDPDLFTMHRTINKAKQICLTCPLCKSCGTSAIERTDDTGGVYGALSQADRVSIRKRLACRPVGS